MRLLKTKYHIEIYEDNSIRFYKVYGFFIFEFPWEITNKKLIDEIRGLINVKP